MGRAPCCDKAKVKKGPWSPEEDALLKDYIHLHGSTGNWIALPHKIGLKRCGKSCRLRWLNYLRPNIKHGDFSDYEDTIICRLFASIGSRWSIIAAQLPGRTDNDIKNYWNTKLKKKFMANNNIIMAPTSTQFQMRPHQTTVYPSPPNISFHLHQPSISSKPFQYDITNCYGPALISSNSIGPNGFMGPAHDNYGHDYYGVSNKDDEDNLLVFGGDDQHDDENQNFLFSTNYGYSSSSTAAGNGCSLSENPLDYSFEEIKKIISTNNNMCNDLNLFVDEAIKTEGN